MSRNNSQHVVSSYAILRARAVVVPINVMTTADELTYYVQDSQARVAIVAQGYIDVVRPHLNATTGLQEVITFSYRQALNPNDYPTGVPDWIRTPPKDFSSMRLNDLNETIITPHPEPGNYPRADYKFVIPYNTC